MNKIKALSVILIISLLVIIAFYLVLGTNRPNLPYPDSYHSIKDPLTETVYLELRSEITALNNQMTKLDNERRLWGTTLDRSNAIFAAFMIIVIFGFGLLSNFIFNKRLNKQTTKIDQNIDDINKRMARSELLQYRSLFFTFCRPNLYDSALMWGTRFIKGLYEQGMNEKGDRKLLVDFIQNIIDMYNIEIKANPNDYDVQELNEIITNLLFIYSLELSDISKDMKTQLRMILSDLHDNAARLLGNNSLQQTTETE